METSINFFTASPECEGVWRLMHSKTYGIVNCLLQIIIMKKDCPRCPIYSTLGRISNNSEISFVHHQDVIIVWDASKGNISKQCFVNEVKSGSGLVMTKNEQTFQLIDNAA